MNSEFSKKGIKISPMYYRQDWEDLDLSKNDMTQWDKAIEIFKDRIEGRYLQQIAALDHNKDRKIGSFAGFAIMSLACLLIETLEQFWTGNIQTSRKLKTRKHTSNKFFNCFKGWKKKNPIPNDALVFFSFFQRSENFKVFFDTPEKAGVFYSSIRCGLLHQGQTKGRSLIHIKKDQPLLKWIDERNIHLGMSINRRMFMNEITHVYNKYLAELQNPHNLNFRKRTLEKKMKHIVCQA